MSIPNRFKVANSGTLLINGYPYEKGSVFPVWDNDRDVDAGCITLRNGPHDYSNILSNAKYDTIAPDNDSEAFASYDALKVWVTANFFRTSINVSDMFGSLFYGILADLEFDPGAPTANISYWASKSGVYTNFLDEDDNPIFVYSTALFTYNTVTNRWTSIDLELGFSSGSYRTLYGGVPPTADRLFTIPDESGLAITNARIGQTTLVLGTASITNIKITGNSKIFLAYKVPAGGVGILTAADLVPGALGSFTINSLDPASGSVKTADTSTVNYWVVEMP